MAHLNLPLPTIETAVGFQQYLQQQTASIQEKYAYIIDMLPEDLLRDLRFTALISDLVRAQLPKMPVGAQLPKMPVGAQTELPWPSRPERELPWP